MTFMNQNTMRDSWGRCIACYFVVFAFISFLAAAAPSRAEHQDHTTTLEAPKLVRRYNVVSSEQYRDDCLRTGKVQRVPGIFWTSFPTSGTISQQGYLTATTWARNFFGSRENFVTYATASDTYGDLNTINDECDAPTEEEMALQVRRLSKGYSAAVHGKAYLVMPDGANFYPQSVWSVWEWPTITRNPEMEEVIIVFLPSGQQTLLWARRDGPKPVGVEAPPGRRRVKA